MLQPLTSSIGASSTSISHLVLFVCMSSRLLLRLGASFFFLPGSAFADDFSKTVAAIALGRGLAGLCLLDASAVFVGTPVAGHQDQASR
ncbi:hypothetical protein IAE38_000760 [Pseudomonas sp. S32]|nr:hypothetical protein [Pseudomonas sp. S32]